MSALEYKAPLFGNLARDLRRLGRDVDLAGRSKMSASQLAAALKRNPAVAAQRKQVARYLVEVRKELRAVTAAKSMAEADEAMRRAMDGLRQARRNAPDRETRARIIEAHSMLRKMRIRANEGASWTRNRGTQNLGALNARRNLVRSSRDHSKHRSDASSGLSRGQRAARKRAVSRPPAGAQLRRARVLSQGPPVKARVADKDGIIETSWGGKLKYRAGKDMIVEYGPNDYGVVRKDIFQDTYKRVSPGVYKKNPDVELQYWIADRQMRVRTLEGTVPAERGDVIMVGTRGEMWPVKPAKARAKYAL